MNDVAIMAKDWLGLVAIAISLGGVFFAWLTAGSKDNAKQIDALRQSNEHITAEHERRIQTLESEMRHLPDKDTVIDIKLSIAKLEGAFGRLDEKLGGVARTVQRIDGYLKER